MSEKIVNLALLAFSILFCVCIILSYGWYTTYKEKHTLDIDRLSPNKARSLMHQYMDKAPGVLRYAWFEPQIGYTLKPNADLSCWNDTFKSNELGYRAGSGKKDENIYRVVFIGDSWTYGMGVSASEAFPYQFEVTANQFGALSQRVEAWTMALPGYNTGNELAALDAFFDLINPDAVVLCPTINDIDSSLGVSPMGNLMWNRKSGPNEIHFFIRSMPMYSYLLLTQWRRVFTAFKLTEQRLREKGIPFFMFFVAEWDTDMVHHFMCQANIASPYAIVPIEYVTGKWRQPQEEFGHGTPEAYTIFAEILYEMVAKKLGWKSMPRSAKRERRSEVSCFFEIPSGDWSKECAALLKARVAKELSYDFTPGSKESDKQCMGTMDWKTGAISSGKSVILLRNKPGSTHLRTTVKRLPQARFLYPIEIELAILSRSGGTNKNVQIFAEGSDTQMIDILIPTDIEKDSAMDFVISVPRSIVDANCVSQSLYILTVKQE